eukprot:CAMPEP_0173403916 /NCGR_PEP_ID=MMETSP1356-20130122/57984_1 /TAXON_ID=77927 ORGANISM="Hemiselmis virescens, Strain PCC157" /NCGR_SAMPLE_ID=MMETSP1356 /ASSEMBLY_ACC=CAM_ASM_000847 /LENGTH=85 /DNA_ID=CAMNT_0014364503 /DNA_START=809 /DNA_END=1063 /DNA_ORIENTATION=+
MLATLQPPLDDAPPVPETKPVNSIIPKPPLHRTISAFVVTSACPGQGSNERHAAAKHSSEGNECPDLPLILEKFEPPTSPIGIAR